MQTTITAFFRKEESRIEMEEVEKKLKGARGSKHVDPAVEQQELREELVENRRKDMKYRSWSDEQKQVLTDMAIAHSKAKAQLHCRSVYMCDLPLTTLKNWVKNAQINSKSKDGSNEENPKKRGRPVEMPSGINYAVLRSIKYFQNRGIRISSNIVRYVKYDLISNICCHQSSLTESTLVTEQLSQQSINALV